ncbi:MAG: DUF1844 domain-containing protein [Ignavibacteriales bacterium]|nr:DUF1844 domain-containing protein [Ignavibacteriales bacterium]
MPESEKDTALFMGLVLMFHAAAMQHMGKTKNPISDKVERSLDQAQFVIDTLDALVAKTKGNLSDEENRFLTNVVKELKLNYVEELAKDQKPGPAAEESTPPEKKD